MANTYKMPDGTIETQFCTDKEMLVRLAEKYLGTEATALLKDVLESKQSETDALRDELASYESTNEIYKGMLLDAMDDLDTIVRCIYDQSKSQTAEDIKDVIYSIKWEV